MTPIGFGQSINMDPRAFNKIFPEEIPSVEEFIHKKKNTNIRSNKDNDESEGTAETAEEEKKIAPNEKANKSGNDTDDEKEEKKEKAFLQGSEIANLGGDFYENYENKLDSMA